jgi:hypothetical protein
MYVKDNYDLFLEHEREIEKQEAKLPRCAWCGEPIKDEYCYELGRHELVCEACIEGMRVSTVDCIYE